MPGDGTITFGTSITVTTFLGEAVSGFTISSAGVIGIPNNQASGYYNVTVTASAAQSTNYNAVASSAHELTLWIVANAGSCTLSSTTGTYTSPNSASVATPAQSGSLTYNGSQQTASFTNSSSYITISNKTGTNAGSYTATAALNNTAYFGSGTLSFTATGTGNIIAASDDTSAVTVSYNSASSTSKTITLTVKKAFTNTVTITVTSEGTGAYGEATATYTVTKSTAGKYIWSDSTTANKSVS